MKKITTKPNAIIMGIDRLITNASSWFEFLTELKIDLDKHRKIYGALKEGKVKWEEVKHELFPIPKEDEERVHKSRFDDSIGNIEISGDGTSTVRQLQERGYHICLVSGSIDLIVKSIADRLGIADWYANTTLQFDNEGFWTDIEYQQAESGVKLEQVKHFIKKYNYYPEEVLVLGHSEADIELFQHFPSVAVGTNNNLIKGLSWEEIDYFPRVLQLLKQFE